MSKLIFLYWVVSAALLLVSCKKDPLPVLVPTPIDHPTPALPTTGNKENDPLNFGNPTQAQTALSYTGNDLMDQNFYKLAFSSTANIPVWVAWHFQSEDIGGTPRQDDFREDPSLPNIWYRVPASAFSGSGFDR